MYIEFKCNVESSVLFLIIFIFIILEKTTSVYKDSEVVCVWCGVCVFLFFLFLFIWGYVCEVTQTIQTDGINQKIKFLPKKSNLKYVEYISFKVSNQRYDLSDR